MKEIPSYNRDKVPSDKRATCPCCLRAMRVTTKGRMVRHGWKETGRRVGEYGSGFQWGDCHGGAHLPLEQTDKHGRMFAERLREEVAKVNKALRKHESRKVDSYSYRWDRADGRFGIRTTLEWIERHLKAAGFRVTVETGTVKDTTYRRVRWLDTINVVFEVREGDAERRVTSEHFGEHRSYFGPTTYRTVPSFEAMREAYIRQLAATRDALVAQAERIEATIRKHAANPSNGAEDKKRGPVVHYQFRRTYPNGRVREFIGCGSRAYSIYKSENPDEVTCKRCRKYIER